MNKILLFEPWGLGDLVISLYIAKHLQAEKVKVDLICSKRWYNWVSQLDFLSQIFTFDPPWTKRKNKYKLSDYLNNNFKELKSFVKSNNYDIAVDIRGDIRHYIFIRYYLSVRSISTVKKKIYVYDKPKIILNNLGYKNFFYKKNANRNIKNIVCFFDASDINRSVPINKRIEIVNGLISKGYHVYVILPISKPEEYWSCFFNNVNFGLLLGPIDSIIERVKEFDLCISTDSGWLHLSNFLGLKTIGLLGFDTRYVWLPPFSNFILSEKYYKAKYRYKKKYFNTQPLASLEIKKVFDCIDNQNQL